MTTIDKVRNNPNLVKLRDGVYLDPQNDCTYFHRSEVKRQYTNYLGRVPTRQEMYNLMQSLRKQNNC